MKPVDAFQADFDGVRVHTDANADALNHEANAVTFTAGQDIFFSHGAYSPGTSSGRELLAHELTHVVQESGLRSSGQAEGERSRGRLGKRGGIGWART